MDSQTPTTPPVAEFETLRMDQEMHDRVVAAMAGDAVAASDPRMATITKIDPDGYAKKAKSTPNRIVSLAERAKKRDAIFDFPVPELDDEIGEFVARVSKPSIISLIEAGTMPPHLRKAVDKIISSGDVSMTDKLAEDIAGDGPSEAYGLLLTVVNYLCISGWVEPKVVATYQEEEEHQGSIHFSRIPPEARMRYWSLVQNEAKEMAEGAATFPGSTDEPGPVGADMRVDGV